MKTNEKGFHLLPILLLIAVVAIIGVVVWRISNSPQQPGKANIPGSEAGPAYKALPECGNEPILTTLPIDLNALDYIAPLGAINPPEHTLPTDHMYFMYKYERPDTERYNLVAPAKSVVTSLSYSGEIENGQYKNTDFSIALSPCRGMSFRLSHVNTLEGALQGEIGMDGKGAECNRSTPVEGKEKLHCMKQVDIKVEAGEVIGKVGAKYVAAWDFWAFKEGYVNPAMITPAYHQDANSVCPIDYFTPELKDQLYALVKRAGEPRCGEIGQDKKDALQGSWFAHKKHREAQTDWNSHFTLAHHSLDSAVGVLAVAGKISQQPLSYNFTPRHEGVVNREPAETVAGTLYCYQHDNNTYFTNGTAPGTGKVLLRLVDNHTMQAEHKTGNCGADERFSNPTTYYR